METEDTQGRCGLGHVIWVRGDLKVVEHALIAASGKHESYSFVYLENNDQKVV